MTESGDCGGRVAAIHIGKGASMSDMFLEEKVGVAVRNAGTDALGIVGEVDDSVLDSFFVSGLRVHLVKHSVLPGGS